jgi:hypothetical protein
MFVRSDPGGTLDAGKLHHALWHTKFPTPVMFVPGPVKEKLTMPGRVALKGPTVKVI